MTGAEASGNPLPKLSPAQLEALAIQAGFKLQGIGAFGATWQAGDQELAKLLDLAVARALETGCADRRVRNAAMKVLREALDAQEVHPCDSNDDAIRARGLYGPLKELFDACGAPNVEVPSSGFFSF